MSNATATSEMPTAPVPQNMRTFTTIWTGQFISLIGSDLTSFALGVWVYEQTRQATPFAMVALASTIPRIALAPLAGALADRWNRRRIMMITDTLAALLMLGVAVLYYFEALQVWHVILLALLSALCGAFQEPAYMASITMIVPKKDLGRANGMMQMSEAVGRLAGPLLAGVLYMVVGVTGVFLIDFITYFFAIGALMLVRIPQPERTGSDHSAGKSIWTDVIYGWKYLAVRAGMMGLLLYFALVNFLLNLAAVLNSPLVLSFSQPSSLGIVQSVSGAAMLVGSVIMSAWGGPRQRVVGVCGFIALIAVGLIVIGSYASVVTIALGYFVFLFALPFASGSSAAIWQSKVEPSLQGRVLATRTMISRSMMPLAFVLAGPLADAIFEPVMATSGVLASTPLGDILGAGPGRGIGLIFVTSGVLLLVVTGLAYSNPRICNIETELPDAIPDGSEEESTREGEIGGEVRGEEATAPA